ncbi:MAG TPA: methyltransferase domain-containing protein [Methylocystis sp.]|jgi:ubiquinone/menaquinone biosynthesis C-methylase UbiE
MPERVKALLANIHDKVLAKYYGSGLVIPEMLDGRRVLDLGCGSGRDVYALSQLVGASGEVVGVE